MFTVSLSSLVIALIGVLFVGGTLRYAWKGLGTIWGAFMWTLLSCLIVGPIVFYEQLKLILNNIGVSDPTDLLFSMVIAILIFIVFQLLVKIENMQQKITALVRHEALKEADCIENDSSK